MFDFTDQVVVVTGAAGNLGRARPMPFTRLARGWRCWIDSAMSPRLCLVTVFPKEIIACMWLGTSRARSRWANGEPNHRHFWPD